MCFLKNRLREIFHCRQAVVMLCVFAFVVYVDRRYNRECRHESVSRRPNSLITDYDSSVARRLAQLVDRRANASDPELIRLIMDLMDPPSKHMVKMSRQLMNTPQSQEIDIIFKKKVCSYTVE